MDRPTPDPREDSLPKNLALFPSTNKKKTDRRFHGTDGMDSEGPVFSDGRAKLPASLLRVAIFRPLYGTDRVQTNIYRDMGRRVYAVTLAQGHGFHPQAKERTKLKFGQG